jgi:zinc transport system substrate-binding protein
MKKLLYLMILILPVSLFLAGCGSKDQNNGVKKDENRLVVYTTVYPLQYITEEIGKEFVQVETIYPPGADTHNFEPTQKDMMKLADSDLFIYIGLGMEGFADKVEKTLKREDVTLLPAGEKIQFEDTANEEEANPSEDEHDHGDIDPHVWLDPIYTKDLAKAVKDELVKKLPEQKDLFEKNYAQLTEKLDDLNTEFESTLAKSKDSEIIVSHAAYGYWEKRYGIKQISISGISPSDEPDQKELTKIVNTIKDHNIKYIFFEQNVNSKLAQVIQEEIDGESLILHNLSVLTDEDISKKRDYFSIMEDNLNALEKALND